MLSRVRTCLIVSGCCWRLCPSRLERLPSFQLPSMFPPLHRRFCWAGPESILPPHGLPPSIQPTQMSFPLFSPSPLPLCLLHSLGLLDILLFFYSSAAALDPESKRDDGQQAVGGRATPIAAFAPGCWRVQRCDAVATSPPSLLPPPPAAFPSFLPRPPPSSCPILPEPTDRPAAAAVAAHLSKPKQQQPKIEDYNHSQPTPAAKASRARILPQSAAAQFQSPIHAFIHASSLPANG